MRSKPIYKISELITKEFTSSEVSEAVLIQNINTPEIHMVGLVQVFEWIKEQAINQGLTVELKEGKIIFIKGGI